MTIQPKRGLLIIGLLSLILGLLSIPPLLTGKAQGVALAAPQPLPPAPIIALTEVSDPIEAAPSVAEGVAPAAGPVVESSVGKGAFLPGQLVTAAQVSAETATVSTDSAGRYRPAPLPRVQYILSIPHQGYDPDLPAILTRGPGQSLTPDLQRYPLNTGPHPQDPMLINPLDSNGAPTAQEAERLARLQGLTGKVVSIEETKLSGWFLVNYKIGDEIRVAVQPVNHDVWELKDESGRNWWIIKICGNLVSLLPEEIFAAADGALPLAVPDSSLTAPDLPSAAPDWPPASPPDPASPPAAPDPALPPAPGGDNPGVDQPGGSDDPGGDQPGGSDDPGGDQPGEDDPGDQPGGSDDPGGDQPGGDQCEQCGTEGGNQGGDQGGD